MRRRILIAVVASLALVASGASADENLPTPEPGVVEFLPAGSCTKDAGNPYDRDYRDYYGAGFMADCKRMHITFGPLTIKPGQNDVLIQPVTFEKPMYDGYMLRFKPDLVDPVGATPPVEEIHLHHGTWLNANRSYGDGPWIASGEEKTIAPWPKGYGLEIRASDTWLFLHMVHNATSIPRVAWVRYTIDFIKKDVAQTRYGIRNTKQIWLDVMGGSFHRETQSYPWNPIFNTQKGFGADGHCSFPAENCANFNPLGNVSAQQGKDVSGEPTPASRGGLPLEGMDEIIQPGFLDDPTTPDRETEGTLVMMGGHLHMGGLDTTIDLLRNIGGVWQKRTIHISEGWYWQSELDGIPGFDDDPLNDRIGAPPISWDVSMTGVTKDVGWAVRVKEGDILRLNATYETELASWYENMGIVMTWVAPGDLSGVNVFDPAVTVDTTGYPTQVPALPLAADGSPLPQTCTNSATTLCALGTASHPHIVSSGNHGRCSGSSCPPFPAPAGVVGPDVTEVPIANFVYGPADLTQVATLGVPRVKVGDTVRFTNLDSPAYIFHTITRCAFPCTGPTTVDYPIPDGAEAIDPDGAGPLPASPRFDDMDFDSSELGFGFTNVPGSPVGSCVDCRGSAGRATWDFTPTRAGTFTFFCRIHPFMRGAIEVYE